MEVIFEILFEAFFQLVGEAFIELTFELGHNMIWGRDEDAEVPPWGVGAAKLVILVAALGGLGFWRGWVAADRGQLGWGLAVVVGISVACAIALAVSGGTSSAPPSSTMKRMFLWWPPQRLVWFATANGAFTIAYIGAFLVGS